MKYFTKEFFKIMNELGVFDYYLPIENKKFSYNKIKELYKIR